MSPIEPRLAPVRPRVHVHAGGIARPLDEEVGELLAKRGSAKVWLVGGNHSGKSTALAHLAAVFATEARLQLHDGTLPRGETTQEGVVQVVALPAAVSARATRDAVPEHVWQLAAWCDDDCLDYLRTTHGERAAAAMAAWRASNAEHDLLAWPGLCTQVLDVLARPDGPADPHRALRVVLAQVAAVHGRPQPRDALRPFLQDGDRHELPPSWPVGVCRSRSARALIAAEALFELASRRGAFVMQRLSWSRELAIAIMVILQHEPERAAELCARIRGEHESEVDVPLALSLLAVANQGFRPERDVLADVAHAFLAFADLHGKELRGDCSGVHLAHANLRGAGLDCCRLVDAAMAGADLTGATMSRSLARGLFAAGVVADWLVAEHTDLAFARLQNASLQRAKLANASLFHAQLDGADLSGADLAFADLSRTDLRAVNLHGASLRSTKLQHTNAGDVAWRDLAATGADWSHSDLTGSSLPRARLQCSSFANCGLAHIDWPGADLRNADLRGATFHLGNARSGLVGSELASEGTRTGFYTDESLEEHFKAPEQVRKANLQGADLRGAKLDGVDFYLVDVRGAKLSPEQVGWLRRCRALLGERAAE